MIETLPLDEFDRHFDNIFEAIVAVAKRARQINQIQKQLIDADTDALSNGDFDDEGVNKDFMDGQYIKLPKPTTIALQEMLEGKLQTRYPEAE